MIDVGARLTVALARPLGKLLDLSADEIREDIRQETESPDNVAVAAGLRSLAWAMAGGIALGLYVPVMIVNDIVDLGESVVTAFGWLPAIACMVVGAIAACKCVLAWYVNPRWWRRSRMLRWLGTPNNADIVTAVLICAFGVAIV